MDLFLRAHRARRAAAAAACLSVVSWVLATRTLALPQLLQGRSAPVAVSVVCAVVLTPVVVTTFGEVAMRFEAGAKRNLLYGDLCLLAAFLAPCLGVLATATIVAEPDGVVLFIRNAAVFTGLSLLALTWAGDTAGVAVPFAYFFVSAFLGADPTGRAQWWAVVRAPVSAGNLAFAAILLTTTWLAYHAIARGRAGRRAAQAPI